MQTTPAAINNSATPPALLKYIPDHLLDPHNRDYYETLRTQSELMVRGVNLSIELHPVEKTQAPTIRVQAEYGQHLSAPMARELAVALLQLADAQEELARQGGAA